MFNTFRKLLGRKTPLPARIDAISNPASPEYVPTPKVKVPGAMHPGVRRKMEQPNRPKPRGVGIVYDSTGRPKITQDWLDHLSPEERRGADLDLAAHGWKINPDNSIARA